MEGDAIGNPIGGLKRLPVHISQRFPERVSVWAEAQAFIYEGKVIEELGSSPRGFIKDITLHAFDPSEPGYTTRDLSPLCRVRHILVSQLSLYGLEPTIWDFLVFPTYYSYCNPP